MKIVILDGYTENPGDLSWEGLAAFGELTVYDRTPYEDGEIIRRIGDADVVFTNKCPISRAVMEACPNLKFISVLATGYNVVDYESAREFGIPVSNVPSYGTDAVGQFAIAMLLEICHHVGHHSAWEFPLVELSGKTMGVIGFGKIGQVTGRIAKSLGMKVLATGSRENAAGRAIADYVDLDTLLSSSDVIALHCPLFPETAGIINKETLAKMKDGVILLNNSRGQLVVEQDLADALRSGKVYAAGLDVVSTEPIRPDNPLLGLPNCLITPHISWGARESRSRIMDCSVDNLRAFVQGAPINVVNGVEQDWRERAAS
jgi:glycerate dehydrogenase